LQELINKVAYPRRRMLNYQSDIHSETAELSSDIKLRTQQLSFRNSQQVIMTSREERPNQSFQEDAQETLSLDGVPLFKIPIPLENPFKNLTEQ
jgi:hypothetical protein